MGYETCPKLQSHYLHMKSEHFCTSSLENVPLRCVQAEEPRAIFETFQWFADYSLLGILLQSVGSALKSCPKRTRLTRTKGARVLNN